MVGVLDVKRKSLAKDIYFLQNAKGSGLAPFDCWLCLRGIKTMALRIEKQQTKGGGSVLSFQTGSLALSKHIIENTRLFSITVSFGSVKALISLPCFMSHASIPSEIRKSRGLTEDLIFLSVGIEDAKGLIVDLNQAIKSASVISKEGRIIMETSYQLQRLQRGMEVFIQSSKCLDDMGLKGTVHQSCEQSS